MVDFQSRDTRPTYGDDADETTDDDGADEATDDDDADETTDEADRPEESAVGDAVDTVARGLEVEADEAGATAIQTLEAGDATVQTREVIDPGFDNVQQILGGLVVRNDVDLIVTLGGAGVGPDDVTVDAAAGLFDRDLPAFGELFRARAREQEGSGVLRTRVTAGIVDGVPVFCLPATDAAVELGLGDVVLPEAASLVEEVQG
jgi:molybdenum cofactor biosynthesis protein B